MASSIFQVVKHTCDRCGTTMEKETAQGTWYPSTWSSIRLGQTGAVIDLCEDCNKELYVFLIDKDAENMHLAVFKEDRVL